MSKSNRYLLTCALPYANGPLHLGHFAGAYLPGDVYARWCRSLGRDVLFICGSDEYGVAVTMSAKQENRTPRAQVDHYHQEHKQLFTQMAIALDWFGRTSDPMHVAPVQSFFTTLLDKGYIQCEEREALYDPIEEQFLADRYVVGTCPHCGASPVRGDECHHCGRSFDAVDLKEPFAKLSGNQLEKRPSWHWYMQFDKFRTQLLTWVTKMAWKPHIKNFVLQFIQELKPRAITRDGRWGVPVPLEDSRAVHKVLYVWFDAPIGYLSMSQAWAHSKGDPDLWRPFWYDSSTTFVQFMGKDNCVFHGALFPAMLMGYDPTIHLPNQLSVNAFLHLEGKKMSKSEGWYVDMQHLLDRFGVDAVRYYLCANAPESADSSFSWDEFGMRVNSELVGKIGNYIHRVLLFLQRKAQGCAWQKENVDSTIDWQGWCARLDASFESRSTRSITAEIVALAQEANGYFDAQAPWKLVKQQTDTARLAQVLHTSLRYCHLLALVLEPIVPKGGSQLKHILGIGQQVGSLQERLECPLRLESGEPEPLFEKIDPVVIRAEKTALGVD